MGIRMITCLDIAVGWIVLSSFRSQGVDLRQSKLKQEELEHRSESRHRRGDYADTWLDSTPDREFGSGPWVTC